MNDIGNDDPRQAQEPAPERRIRVAVIVINRDRPDITDRVYEQVSRMGNNLDTRFYVVECGSRPEGRSRHMTHYFRDRDYRGRYYGFNRGLEFARADGPWDYVWFVVNDIRFDEGVDVLTELVEVMESEPRMAILGPAQPDDTVYQGCHPQPGRRWHKASTVHGLAWLMRYRAIEEVGYCNPRFRYSQGAGSELAYQLYRNGWFLAYSDRVSVYHDDSGSTYGKVTRISRHEYQRRARRFASRYLARHYGKDWDQLFTSVLPPDVEHNTFPWQKEVWNRELPKERPWWNRVRKCLSPVKQTLLRLTGRKPH